MYITFNPHTKPIALNNKTNNSYFNRDMKSDCVELSFKRKKKDAKGDLVKDICKFGFKENEVLKVLSDTKSQNKINEYIETNGRNNFNRELTLGEIFTSVANDFTEHQTNKYIKLNDLNVKGKTPFARLLKTKEVINIAKNIEVEDVPRYLELIDNNRKGEPFLSDSLTPAKTFNCIHFGYNDTQAETYLQLSEEDSYLFFKLGCDYNLGPMDIQFVSNKQNCEDYLFLTSKDATELFSRPLDHEEAIGVIEYKFNKEQVQTFINYIDANDEINNTNKYFTRPIYFIEALEATRANFDKEKTQKLINVVDSMDYAHINYGYTAQAKMAREAVDIVNNNFSQEQIEEYNFLRKNRYCITNSKEILDVFTDKEKYSRFKLLQKEKNNITEAPMTLSDAFNVTLHGFDDEKVQMYEFILRPENNYSNFFILGLFSNKEKFSKFIDLKKNPPKDIARELSAKEILYCIEKELNEEEIKETALLLNEFESLEMVSKILEFSDYKDVKNINELNLTQRRDLLKKIIKLNNVVRPETNKTYSQERYKLIPRTEKQFNNIVKELFLSIGINDIGPMESGQNEFIESIQSIAQQVKTTDIDKINIDKLTLPQTNKLINNLTNDKLPLKVLKNVVNNPEFNKLSETDKNVLIMSSLLVNVAKSEEENPKLKEDSAFEAYYISKSLGFSEDDSFKIYTMIANNNWYEEIKNSNGRQQEILVEDTAFNLRYGNSLELSKIFCRANSTEVDNVEIDKIVDKIIEKLNVIKSTQIILPQTKIPKASEAKNVKTMTIGGVTNKVLYMDSANEDLSIYGFEKGATKENWRALVHAFSTDKNLSILSSLNVVDTDSVLSSSYISTKEYKCFRGIGLILDVLSDNINAGLWRDFGSGYAKSTENIKRAYIFPNKENKRKGFGWQYSLAGTRKYIPDLIKKEMQLSDEEYIRKAEKLRNCKSVQDIEKIDKNFADSILSIFDKVGLGQRRDGRRYNEILVSQRKIQGAFAYDMKYEDVPPWMRKYAQDNDLLLIILGEKEPKESTLQ